MVVDICMPNLCPRCIWMLEFVCTDFDAHPWWISRSCMLITSIYSDVWYVVNSDEKYQTLSKRVNVNMIYIPVAPGHGLIWIHPVCCTVARGITHSCCMLFAWLWPIVHIIDDSCCFVWIILIHLIVWTLCLNLAHVLLSLKLNLVVRYVHVEFLSRCMWMLEFVRTNFDAHL